jgi:hypothetical protein
LYFVPFQMVRYCQRKTAMMGPAFAAEAGELGFPQVDSAQLPGYLPVVPTAQQAPVAESEQVPVSSPARPTVLDSGWIRASSPGLQQSFRRERPGRRRFPGAPQCWRRWHGLCRGTHIRNFYPVPRSWLAEVRLPHCRGRLASLMEGYFEGSVQPRRSRRVSCRG